MHTAALAGLIALLAVTYWRPLRRVRRGLGASYLLASGYAFVLVGLVAGAGLDVTGQVRVGHGLAPLITFAAAWVGFSAGSRFERRVLRTVPLQAYLRALVPAAVAAVVVGAASAGVLVFAGAPAVQTAAAALCLAAVAASTGPTLAAVVRGHRAGRQRRVAAMLRMAEFSAGVADGLVIVLVLFGFAVFHPGADAVASSTLLLASVAGSVALGAALWGFLGGSAADDERLLFGLAVLAMVAGLAAWLGVAPAALAAVAAIVMVNLPGPATANFARVMRRVERPAVVILMAAAGLALASAWSWLTLWLAALLVLVRLATRLVSAGPVREAIGGAPALATPAGWTLCLTQNGILGLVIALGFYQVWPDGIGGAVLAATAIAGLVNELLAPSLLLAVVRRMQNQEQEP